MCGVFTTTKVGDCFSLKSAVPMPLRACVVYQFKCLRDATMSYVGKTKRHLLTRCSEHLKKPTASAQPTAIGDHLKTCTPCRSATVNNFSVIRSARTDYDLCLHEALLIQKIKPSLNKQLFQSGAQCVLRIFA